MGLIVTEDFARNNYPGFLDTDRITPEEFLTWKDNYKKRNRDIGSTSTVPPVDLSDEPEKVYFERSWLENIIRQPIDSVTLRLGCRKVGGKLKKIRLIMCGSDKLSNPKPESMIFDGYYPEDKPGESIPKSEIEKARILFKERNQKVKLRKEFNGYSHKLEVIKAWLDDPKNSIIKHIVVYFGVDGKERTNLMIAGSTEDFKDMVPVDDSDNRYALYDNGNQCCQD